MTLDPDLQRILTPNAKVYHTQTKRQGRVTLVTPDIVTVDYGNKAKSDTDEYDIDEFSQMLIDDVIVANSRLTMGDREGFKIKPRVKSVQTLNVTPDVKDEHRQAVENATKFLTSATISPLIGYINFSTGKFSPEPKKGYTKVEYRKALERVTLELTSEQVEELREKGWVK